MAKNAEATLWLKVKTEGQKLIDGMSRSVMDLGKAAKEMALAGGAAFSAFTAGVIKMGLDADKFENIKRAFTSMTESQGVDSKKLLESMKAASAGTVSELELMRQANQAMLLGLPVDRFDDMLKVAQSAALSTGQSMEYMLTSIVTGIGRSSRLMLDNLGIIVDVDKAHKDFADSVGREVEQLTDAEKKTAFLNAAMKVGLDNAAKSSINTDSLTFAWERAKVQFSEAAIAIGTELIPMARSMLSVFGDVISSVKEMTDRGIVGDWANACKKVALEVSVAFSSLASNFRGFTKLISFDFEGMGKEAEQYEKDRLEYLKKYSDLNEEQIKRKVLLEYAATGHISAYDRKKYSADILGKEKEESDHQAKILEGQLRTHVIANQKFKEEKDKLRAEEEKKEEKKRAKEQAKYLKDLEKDNERALAEYDKFQKERLQKGQAAIKKEADLSEKEFKARMQERDKLEEEHAKLVETLGSAAVAGGYQAIASAAVTAAYGPAAGKLFDLLSEDTEKFSEDIAEYLSAAFIGNIARNIPVMISAIIASIPQLGKAFAEIFTDPEIPQAFAKSMANAFTYDAMFGDHKFDKELAAKQAELDTLITSQRREEFARRSGILTEASKDGANRIKDIEKELADAIKDLEKQKTKAAEAEFKKRMDVETKILDAAKKKVLDLEGKLASLRQKLDDEGKTEKEIALKNAIERESSLLERANDDVNSLETDRYNREFELRKLGYTDAQIAADVQYQDILTQLVDANTFKATVQAEYDAAELTARQTLGIALVATTQQQITETETALSTAKAAEVAAQATWDAAELANKTALGIGLEAITQTTVDNIAAKLATARAAEIIAEEERNAEMLRLRQEYADALDDIEAKKEKLKAEIAAIEEKKEAPSKSKGTNKWDPRNWDARDLYMNSGGIVRAMASGGVVDNQMIQARVGEAVIPAQTVKDNPQAVGALLHGRSGGGGGTVININVNGGLLGNEADARKFATKIDSELLKLRRDNKSVAFDSAVY